MQPGSIWQASTDQAGTAVARANSRLRGSWSGTDQEVVWADSDVRYAHQSGCGLVCPPGRVACLWSFFSGPVRAAVLCRLSRQAAAQAADGRGFDQARQPTAVTSRAPGDAGPGYSARSANAVRALAAQPTGARAPATAMTRPDTASRISSGA